MLDYFQDTVVQCSGVTGYCTVVEFKILTSTVWPLKNFANSFLSVMDY